MHEKFGEDLTMWSGVIRVGSFMAKDRNSPCHHGNCGRAGIAGLHDAAIHYRRARDTEWALHLGEDFHFLRSLGGAREHSVIIHHVVVYYVLTTPCKLHENQMMFVT